MTHLENFAHAELPQECVHSYTVPRRRAPCLRYQKRPTFRPTHGPELPCQSLLLLGNKSLGECRVAMALERHGKGSRRPAVRRDSGSRCPAVSETATNQPSF